MKILSSAKFAVKDSKVTNILNNTRKFIPDHKPFKCEICRKGFKQNTDLKKYARIRTGEKPFKFEICGRSFIRKYELTAHKKPYR